MHEDDSDSKRALFEKALGVLRKDEKAPVTYHLVQSEFDAIPRSPWVYWLSGEIRNLFKRQPSLSGIAESKVGINTGCNERFVRMHWELPARQVSPSWKPYVSGGPKRKYYGNLLYFLNWTEREMLEYPGSALRAKNYQGREGLTYGLIGSSGPSVRYLPPGFYFSSGGNCIFPTNANHLTILLGILSSAIVGYLLKVINPTINLSVGDLLSLPIALPRRESQLKSMVEKLLWFEKYRDSTDERTIDFKIPVNPTMVSPNNHESLDSAFQKQIDDEVNRLYGITNTEQAAIEEEQRNGIVVPDDESNSIAEQTTMEENQSEEYEMNREELAVRWISYAVGIVLGRYHPGVEGELGSAIYRNTDFSIGSLPAPSEAEFDELVCTRNQFAYVDRDGGRHIFSAEVERALRKLMVPDGITVLEEHHDRDLPTRVSRALELMLGADAAQAVAQVGAGGDLRGFLEKDFFTRWHIKWYRKRPVYWYLQSSRRSYGFVIFHERITADTLYTIQREPYLDTRRNAVHLAYADLQGSIRTQGKLRRQVERQMDDLRALQDELHEFSKALEAITSGGYKPAPNWIDDGVILRMAPLWSVIPIWRTEPKKYWEELKKGDFDWSHVAAHYWEQRVREKSKTNKSFAIAHDLEHLYKGD